IAPLQGIARLEVAFLLGDEGPLLSQLELPGLRGKKPPTRGGALGRADRPGGRSASPCSYRPRRGDWWRGCRNPRGCGQGGPRPCPEGGASLPRECPCVRRKPSYTCGRRPCGCDGSSPTNRGNTGCPWHGRHGRGTIDSGSRSVRWGASGLLPVANSLPDTSFSLHSSPVVSTNVCTHWPDTTVFSRLRGFFRYARDELCGGHAIPLRETQ